MSAATNKNAETEDERLARQHREMDAVMGAGNPGDVALNNSARIFNDEQLSGISSFAEAAAALNSVTNVESFEEYGNGFTVLDTKDKQQLVGVPLVILEWRNNSGDMGDFVSFTCVTKDDRRFIVNDGSTGIASQLRMVETKRRKDGHKTPQAGLLVPGGFRVSEYTYIDEKGKRTPAKTYYLAN